MAQQAILSDPGPLPELAWLPVDKCKVDRRYQRSLDSERSKAQIKRIADRFRWPAFQAILAVKQDDHWLVIDGQHRCAAARLRGFTHVPAVVASDLSIEEQAAAFIEANRERTPVNQFQVFHAMVASGDALACDLARICAKAEIVIPHYAAQAKDMPKGTTLAIGTLLTLARRYKAKSALPISAVAIAYREMRGGLRAPFFDGAARFIFGFDEGQRKAAAEQASAYFKSKSPDEITAAMVLAQTGKVSRGKAIADLIRASAPQLKPAALKIVKKVAKPANKAKAPTISKTARSIPAARAKAAPINEDAQIAAFLEKKGATLEVDWGPHKRMVEAARSFAWDLTRAKPVGNMQERWFLNGGQCDTERVYRLVNLELERRGVKSIPLPKEKPLPQLKRPSKRMLQPGKLKNKAVA